MAKWPSISPDGQWIACTVLNPDTGGWNCVLLPVTGRAEPRYVADLPMLTIPRLFWQRTVWSDDSQTLHFLEDKRGTTYIRAVGIGRGSESDIASFPSQKVLSYDVQNGLLACSLVSATSDIVLVTEF